MELGTAVKIYRLGPYVLIVRYIHNLINKTNKLQNIEYDPSM